MRSSPSRVGLASPSRSIHPVPTRLPISSVGAGSKLPELPKWKSSDDIKWGPVDKGTRYLRKLRRLLAETKEGDGEMLLHMVHKTARPKSIRTGEGD